MARFRPPFTAPLAGRLAIRSHRALASHSAVDFGVAIRRDDERGNREGPLVCSAVPLAICSAGTLPSMAAAVHGGTPSLVVQTAIWRRDRGGCGTLIPTPPMVFELATLCASPETFARSYLRERFRRPLSTSLDVPVVHDGKTLVSHGPPSSWAPGVAQRVQTGALQLGVVRVRLAADDAESKDRPISLSALSSAPPPAARQSTFPLASRLASGRLKVGVHAHPGGLDYMEDENVVHTTADFAFFCVYDGHGGTHAAQFCRDRLHFNIMASPAFNAGDAPTALLEGFAKTEADLLLEQARVRARVNPNRNPNRN